MVTNSWDCLSLQLTQPILTDMTDGSGLQQVAELRLTAGHFRKTDSLQFKKKMYKVYKDGMNYLGYCSFIQCTLNSTLGKCSIDKILISLEVRGKLLFTQDVCLDGPESFDSTN